MDVCDVTDDVSTHFDHGHTLGRRGRHSGRGTLQKNGEIRENVRIDLDFLGSIEHALFVFLDFTEEKIIGLL